MKRFRKPGYEERLEKQTLDWLKGNSVHNTEDDECCPDFSCCYPDLLAPEGVREVFVKAWKEEDHRTVVRLFGEFLSQIIEKECSKEETQIAGLEEQRREL